MYFKTTLSKNTNQRNSETLAINRLQKQQAHKIQRKYKYRSSLPTLKIALILLKQLKRKTVLLVEAGLSYLRNNNNAEADKMEILNGFSSLSQVFILSPKWLTFASHWHL